MAQLTHETKQKLHIEQEKARSAVSLYDYVLHSKVSKEEENDLTIKLMFNHHAKDAIKQSEKFLFSQSALNMLTTLLPIEQTRLASLPKLSISPTHAAWIELTEAIRPYYQLPLWTIRAFHFTTTYSEAIRSQVEAIHHSQLSRSFDIDPSYLLTPVHKRSWTLTIFGESGNMFRCIYDPASRSWMNDRMPCSWRKDGCSRDFGQDVLCEKCNEVFHVQCWWFAIAYEMIHQQFSTVENPQPFEKTEIYYRHRIASNNPKKRKYLSGAHSYNYVKFDVSTRERTSSNTQNEPTKQGSWTEIDKDTIIYVPKFFTQSTRMLDPEQNSRWKFKREVSVKEHTKRVPMRVYNVKKVIASKYI